MAPNQLYATKEKRNAPRTDDFMGVAETLFGLNRFLTIQRKIKGSRNLQGIQYKFMRLDKAFKALIAMKKTDNPQRSNKLRGPTYLTGNKDAIDASKWVYTKKGKAFYQRSKQLRLPFFTTLAVKALIRQIFLINLITSWQSADIS